MGYIPYRPLSSSRAECFGRGLMDVAARLQTHRAVPVLPEPANAVSARQRMIHPRDEAPQQGPASIPWNARARLRTFFGSRRSGRVVTVKT
jgi:hypothetical protein